VRVPRFVTEKVSEVISAREGLQRVMAGRRRAYVLTRLVGEVAVGDEVVLNVTATDLGLGTGGWDVVHWNLSRRELAVPGGGHVMKLRYTSLQADTGVEEEHDSSGADLAGFPVAVCFLHSQIGPLSAAFRETADGGRLGLVMTDSAALPIDLSDLVADLRSRALLHTTVTIGQAFGGEHEATNLLTGLETARRAGCTATVVAPGPGVVGTGTTYGFSGLEVAPLSDLAAAAGADVVIALRWSEADARERHRGLSHHSSTVLGLTSRPATVALAENYQPGELPSDHRVATVRVPDPAGLLERAGLSVTTMGRGPEADPGFFAMAAAAGVVLGRKAGPLLESAT
jgi:hypothetical protein